MASTGAIAAKRHRAITVILGRAEILAVQLGLDPLLVAALSNQPGTGPCREANLLHAIGELLTAATGTLQQGQETAKPTPENSNTPSKAEKSVQGATGKKRR